MSTIFFCITTKIKQHAGALGAICVAMILINCSKSDVNPSESKLPKAVSTQQLLTAQPNNIKKFWRNGAALVNTLEKQGRILQRTTKALLTSVTPETLAEAQEAWRNIATTTEQLQFYFQLAEVAPKHFQYLYQAKDNLASNPIQPGYLDSYGEYPYSGIVHDIGFELTLESLRQQNRSMDEEEVLLGIYAIEYILFGDNDRISSDFNIVNELNEQQQKSGLLTPQELPSNRRNTLLSLQVNALIDDIKTFKSIWEATDTTQPIPLAQTWDALTAATQSAVMKSAIETDNAKLMLRIVDIKELIDTRNIDVNRRISVKLTTLAVNLNTSIQALTILLPEQKRAEISSLTQAREELKTLRQRYKEKNTTLYSSDDDTAQSLQQVYQYIQAAATPIKLKK